MFYFYTQNNSGGRSQEPAIKVVIEADTAEEANSVAIEKGVYFDGCNEGVDCKCCGDRWERAGEEDYKKGIDYSEFVDFGCYRKFYEEEGIPLFVVYFKDGTVKE